MGALWRYLRAHPWQRRVLTLGLALVVGAGGAIVLYPLASDWLLVRALGSADPAERRSAIARAIDAAGASPRTAAYLERRLDTDDDALFAAIATVLRRIGRFDVPGRDPLQKDRLRAIELATTRSETDPAAAAQTRWLLLAETIRDGGRNEYTRRALATAATDEDAEVRALAAVLAGRLEDDDALRALLADADGRVAGEAALCAGIAARAALADDLSTRLAEADPQVAGGAAYGLLLVRAEGASARIADRLRSCADAELRDRLLHVAALAGDEPVRQAVREVLAATPAGQFPPAAALLAAGRLGLDEAGPHVLALLRAAPARPAGLRESQLAAALEAAEALDLPVRREARDICQALWSPDLPHALSAAARLLGRQAARADQPDEPSRADVVATLRQAAVFETTTATRPAGVPPQSIHTPRASAAAAVALWLLGDEVADLYVRDVTALGQTLPGDYVAWHLGLTGAPEAFELGLAMLPALDDPQPVHNDDERSAGAMLLALAARGDEQRQAAAERIRSRLAGGRLGPERNFQVRGAYHCALALLGDEAGLAEARGLLEIVEFPRRRVLTALWGAGERPALDWLLWNTQVSHQQIAVLLAEFGLGEVLARVAPSLPRVDVAADPDLRRWQAQILQDTWAIRRESVRLEPPR